MAVVSKIRRAKDHYSIEHGEYFGFAPGHIAVPQLQMTAVVLLPILVQIQQEIESSVEAIILMFVKIHVNAQFTAGHDLVKAAPREARIGYQILDSRNGAQKLEE